MEKSTGLIVLVLVIALVIGGSYYLTKDKPHVSVDAQGNPTGKPVVQIVKDGVVVFDPEERGPQPVASSPGGAKTVTPPPHIVLTGRAGSILVKPGGSVSSNGTSGNISPGGGFSLGGQSAAGGFR